MRACGVDSIHSVRFGQLLRCAHKRIINTVVPAMNGHPRDQAKVSVHDRWPLIRLGTGGQVNDATFNTPRLSSPAIFILNTCIVIIMYVIVIKPKTDAT